MRLEITKGKPPVEVRCVKCLRLVPLGHNVYADLDGAPFVDYYCVECLDAEVTDYIREKSK